MYLFLCSTKWAVWVESMFRSSAVWWNVCNKKSNFSFCFISFSSYNYLRMHVFIRWFQWIPKNTWKILGWKENTTTFWNMLRRACCLCLAWGSVTLYWEFITGWGKLKPRLKEHEEALNDFISKRRMIKLKSCDWGWRMRLQLN